MSIGHDHIKYRTTKRKPRVNFSMKNAYILRDERLQLEFNVGPRLVLEGEQGYMVGESAKLTILDLDKRCAESD